MLLIRQAHVYIIAGACLSLGFRFAGSENLAAFNCLVRVFFFFPSTHRAVGYPLYLYLVSISFLSSTNMQQIS